MVCQQAISLEAGDREKRRRFSRVRGIDGFRGALTADTPYPMDSLPGVHVWPDLEALSRAAGERFLTLAQESVRFRRDWRPVYGLYS